MTRGRNNSVSYHYGSPPIPTYLLEKYLLDMGIY
jgi:hypothetical protein